MKIEVDETELLAFVAAVHTPTKSVYRNENIDLCEFCGWRGKIGGFNAHLYTMFDNARKGKLI